MDEKKKPGRPPNKGRSAIYAELHNTFEDILHVVDEVAGGSSISAACRKYHLSERKVYKIASSHAARTCREDDPAIDIQNIPGALYDGYDELYRVIFDIPKNVGYKRPLDYMETVDAVLETLTHDQCICVRNRFCLDGGETITYVQTAHTLGLSEKQVQTLTSKALNKLRFPPRSHQLAYGNDTWYAMQAAEKTAHEREKADLVRQVEEGTMTTLSCPNPMQQTDKSRENNARFEKLHGEGQEQGETYIDQLGLSTRVYMSLRRGGYTTIRQVCEAEDSELRECKGLGRIGVREIREKCRAYTESDVSDSVSGSSGDDENRGDEECDGCDIPIDRLGLSGHIMNALRGARLLTLRDVMTHSDQELLMVPNFSVHGLSDVRIACERYIAEHPSAAVPEDEDKSYPRVNAPFKRLDSTQCQYLYADVFGEAVTLPEDWEETIAYVFDTVLIKRERILLALYYNSRTYGIKAAEKEIAVVLGANTTIAHRAMTVIFRRLREPDCANILRSGIGSDLAGKE